jgi:hypothetical protein
MTQLTVTIEDTANRLMKLVYISTYGLVAEITLERRGEWVLNWLAAGAMVVGPDYDSAYLYLRKEINKMNILHNITRRLKS